MGKLFSMIRIFALHAALLVAVLSFGPASDAAKPDEEPATTHIVVIRDFRFLPETLTVSAGDRIVWKNEDRAPHTATANDVFDSGTIRYDGSWTFVAARKGTFPYICTLHPRMKGTLMVQ